MSNKEPRRSPEKYDDSPLDLLRQWADAIAAEGNSGSVQDANAWGNLVQIGNDYWDISGHRFSATDGSLDTAYVITRLMPTVNKGYIQARFRITIQGDEMYGFHQKKRQQPTVGSLTEEGVKDMSEDLFDKFVCIVPPKIAKKIYTQHHRLERREFGIQESIYPQENMLASTSVK